MSIESLNILNWNARSIKDNEDELFNFLRVHDVHIAVITETFLKPNVKVKRNPNYFVYRNDRLNGLGGGVAIIVHRRIKHKISSSFETKVFETMGVTVETQLGQITIIAAYLPFQCVGQQKNFLKSDLQRLTRNKSKFFIIGDFNAKHRSWNNAQSNSNGKILFDDCSAGFYTIQYPDGPTCFSSVRNPSTIDLVLTDSCHLCSQLITHADFDSDHLPVTFEISQEIICNPNSFAFNYHRADWDQYRTFMEYQFDPNVPLETRADIDNALENFTTSIIEARSVSVPKCEIKFNSFEIDDDLKLLIRLKNVRRRQFQRTHDPAMKILWRDLQKQIRKRFSTLRNEHFANNVKKLDPNSKPFWKLTKILKKPQKPIPALIDGNKTLLTNTEKAQKLANQFESSHNYSLGLTSPIENQVAQENQNIFAQENVFEDSWGTDLNEVRAVIKKCQNMKAPGDDGIYYILIKKNSQKAPCLSW
jgi:exonuclease III